MLGIKVSISILLDFMLDWGVELILQNITNVNFPVD